jgi:hypothetical protein
MAEEMRATANREAAGGIGRHLVVAPLQSEANDLA